MAPRSLLAAARLVRFCGELQPIGPQIAGGTFPWHAPPSCRRARGKRAEIAPVVSDYIDERWGGVLDAEGPRHVAKKEDIDVRVENNVLTMNGQRKREQEVEEDGYFRCERAYGSFSRSFSLPTTVDVKKINASYKEGVLTVQLPKLEEAKPKQIDVKVA